MYTIATLYQLRQYLGLSDSDTADDEKLIHALDLATSVIEHFTHRRFCPRVETVSHTFNLSEKTELLLEDDLLQLTTLTNGDGTTIDSNDIALLPDNSDEPVGVLRLLNGEAFVYSTSPLNAIQVNGVWGWHNRWLTAWLDSEDTVQDNPLTDSATTITVTDADGTDSNNQSPRFQVGHLLRIESEYLRVLAVDTAANTLTVLRGIHGTTSAQYAQSTTIEIFQPAREAELLCIRYAAWLYKSPDSRTFRDISPAISGILDTLRRVQVS